jgi:hypothetical protein
MPTPVEKMAHKCIKWCTFFDENIHTSLQGFLAGGGIAVEGEGDHPAGGELRLDTAGCLISIQDGHLEVHQDYVGM